MLIGHALIGHIFYTIRIKMKLENTSQFYVCKWNDV